MGRYNGLLGKDEEKRGWLFKGMPCRNKILLLSHARKTI